jgi:hypothetical protein
MIEQAISNSSGGSNRNGKILVPPTEIGNGFEVSVHECPKLLVRELKHVFPAQYKQNKDIKMLAILTCQKSLMDLTQFGNEADKEKDRLLETFVQWAQCICSKLAERKYWADYIDPCSGLPVSLHDLYSLFS